MSLPPAVQAFDALAPRFDERFGEWKSVAAQRAAVRRALLRAFPEGSTLLELGGGTGEDALFLAARGRRVTLTDGSPRMVALAGQKAAREGLADLVSAERVSLEELEAFASGPFDGCFSNFASLNCVEDLPAVGRALARLLRPGAHALLVVFGPCCPGEMLVETLRGRPRAALRRLSRRRVAARVSGHAFTVGYPGPRAYARAFGPALELRSVRGIGIAVPPSAAEPEISRFPRVLAALESLDRLLSRPLALLGDHLLLDFRRRRD